MRRRGGKRGPKMDEFIEATNAEGFADGTMRMVEVDEHELLIANVSGAFYAADNRCPHMGGHLAEGVLEGTIVTCPRHHSRFDLTDGHVVRWTDWEGMVLSMGKLIRHPRPLRTYEAKVENGKVMVGPEKAPPAAG
jgi:3-phenylpropionate/trans-cinnamate dioxygenase ferredoxin subunit